MVRIYKLVANYKATLVRVKNIEILLSLAERLNRFRLGTPVVRFLQNIERKLICSIYLLCFF